MSDLSSTYLKGKSNDPWLAEQDQALADARAKDREESLTARVSKAIEGAHQSMENAGIPRILARAPANIVGGVADAVGNAIDTLLDMSTQAATAQAGAVAVQRGDATAADAEAANAQAAQGTSVADVAPEFAKAVQDWRGTLNSDMRTSDEIVAGVGGFVIPFAGYLKATKLPATASKIAKVAKFAEADALTTFFTVDPHAGRFADLLRLADPSDQLVNSYIDYMTDEADDSDMEARWKNVVDNQVATVVLAPVLKAGGIVLKGVYRNAKKAATVGAIGAGAATAAAKEP